jgi:hypothetical protein
MVSWPIASGIAEASNLLVKLDDYVSDRDHGCEGRALRLAVEAFVQPASESLFSKGVDIGRRCVFLQDAWVKHLLVDATLPVDAVTISRVDVQWSSAMLDVVVACGIHVVREIVPTAFIAAKRHVPDASHDDVDWSIALAVPRKRRRTSDDVPRPNDDGDRALRRGIVQHVVPIEGHERKLSDDSRTTAVTSCYLRQVYMCVHAVWHEIFSTSWVCVYICGCVSVCMCSVDGWLCVYVFVHMLGVGCGVYRVYCHGAMFSHIDPSGAELEFLSESELDDDDDVDIEAAIGAGVASELAGPDDRVVHAQECGPKLYVCVIIYVNFTIVRLQQSAVPLCTDPSTTFSPSHRYT